MALEAFRTLTLDAQPKAHPSQSHQSAVRQVNGPPRPIPPPTQMSSLRVSVTRMVGCRFARHIEVSPTWNVVDPGDTRHVATSVIRMGSLALAERGVRSLFER